jgi:hypothetical protein
MMAALAETETSSRKVLAMSNLSNLSNADLNRAIAGARSKRDAFAAGREPAEVVTRLNALLREQARRRAKSERRAARNVERFVNGFGR